jgi:hypothetical protein
MRAKDLEIHAADKKAKDLRAERRKLETKLLRAFDKDDIDGAKGSKGIANIKSSKHPTIKNRKAFIKYLIKHKALDLLQNRIASRAYFDRLEAGEVIPGVEIFESIKVSVRARKK